MDDTTPANEPNDPGLNKIDLSQLQTFNFGTQWTEVKPVSPGRRERDFDRGDRPPRRNDGGGRGAPPRDRRTFHKPAGPLPGEAAPGAPTGEAQAPGGERRRFDRGGPRRDSRGGGERREGGGQSFDRAPYLSPYFVATCYPEDTGFAALVKAVRASCRTYQLFEITQAVLEKNDRFVVVIQRTKPDRPERGPAGPEGEAARPAAEKLRPLYMSMPDHLPFDTEDEAIQHVLNNNLAAFFDTEEVEIDPPKGNFPIINKCGVTGELLGPPNYHRYQQILQQHHAAKLGRMSFDRFRDSIVSVREPEVVAQWQEKMKKATRYIWKQPGAKTTATAAPFPEAGTAASETAPAPVEPAESAPAEPAETPVAVAPVAESTPGEAPPAPAQPEAAPAAEAPAPEAAPAAPAAEVISFDNIEDARLHLLAHARDKVVRAVENVRFHGKLLDTLPPGEIRRALEGHMERQRRFPLDTANALRGRLRREGFTIFKKGSRGVSFVCAVKRRFRIPGQVFSDSITTLIDFIEKNPMVHMKDLPKNFLGVDFAPVPEASPPPEGAPAIEGASPSPTPSPAPFAALTPEQTEKLRKMSNDLRWLVMEGYVTEFSDGTLFAPPPMAPQTGKKSGSDDDNDTEDFPEAPAAEEKTAAKPAKASAESAPTEAAAEPVAPAEPAAQPEPAPEATEAKPAEEPKPEAQS